MSSEWNQTCLVCGVKTKSNCSKCLQAGVDNFFCGADHQRLVWPVHRLVCGPGKAKPFQWPLLTQDEADEAIKHMHESTRKLTSMSGHRWTVAKALQQSAGVQEDRAESAIRDVTVGRPSHRLPVEDQQRVLLVVRAHEYLRLAGLGDPLRPRTTTPHSILNDLAHHDLNVARDGPFWSPDRDEPWCNKYRHQMLVLFALAGKGRESLPRDSPAELQTYISSAYMRAADFFKTTIAPSKPEVAAHLLKEFAPAFKLATELRAKAAAPSGAV
ncbi:hypothetical protein JCM9279_005873 [Rhodotorula babjevae]